MDTQTQVVDSNKWRYITYILTALAICLLVLLLTVAIVWRQNRLDSLVSVEDEACVPCDHFHSTNDKYKDASIEIQEFTNANENMTTCCGTISNVAGIMIKKFTQEKYKDESIRRIFSMSFPGCKNKTMAKASARLAGISSSDIKRDVDHSAIIHWNTSSPSVLHSDIEYLDGQIIISQPGFYYIFLQLTINLHQINTSDDEVTNTDLRYVYSHQIYLQSQYLGTPSKILETAKTICKTLPNQSETTSFTSAIFHLDKYDKVFVKTSFPHSLTQCTQSNFFGLYMI